jgi:aminocarboxymuconate-semialdehyde decarboxylase
MPLMLTRERFLKNFLAATAAAPLTGSQPKPESKKHKVAARQSEVRSRAGAVTRIDAWSHALPKGYLDHLVALPPGPHSRVLKILMSVPSLFDMDVRFRIMDRFGNYTQVLNPVPGVHLTVALTNPQTATEMVKLSNDGMAELSGRYPKRFRGFAASLPMHDPDAAMVELNRVMKLGALGIQIEAAINGNPLDDPAFEPLFVRMAELERPIWIHPFRSPLSPDYPAEKTSRYGLWQALGWPFETSVCLSRLVFAGYLERYPKLRIIAHHGGGMIPHLSGRLGPQLEIWGERLDPELGAALQSLKKPLLDYFRMFYVDTALNGARHAVECVVEFFGVDHVLFGTDAPFDFEDGLRFTTDTIADIDSLEVTDAARHRIYSENASKIILNFSA